MKTKTNINVLISIMALVFLEISTFALASKMEALEDVRNVM
jgi:hypothetical protein